MKPAGPGPSVGLTLLPERVLPEEAGAAVVALPVHGVGVEQLVAVFWLAMVGGRAADARAAVGARDGREAGTWWAGSWARLLVRSEFELVPATLLPTSPGMRGGAR